MKTILQFKKREKVGKNPKITPENWLTLNTEQSTT